MSKCMYTLNPAAVKRYFTAARKKSALYMQSADGVTCLSDGRAVVFARHPGEYDALLRPITGRDAGDWTFRPGCDPAPGTVDLKKAVSASTAGAAEAVLSPLTADYKGASVRLFWLPEKAAVMAVSSAMFDMVSYPGSVSYTAAGPLSRLLVKDASDVPAALFLPIRLDNAGMFTRAVSALYAGTKNPVSELAAVKSELAATKARLASAETVARDALAGERAARAAAKTSRKRFTIKRPVPVSLEKAASFDASAPESDASAPESDASAPESDASAPESDASAEKREPASKSDALAALLDLLRTCPALVCDVHGAKSAAPIMWVSGDTRPHKELLKAAGFKWSAKKSAWWAKKPA